MKQNSAMTPVISPVVHAMDPKMMAALQCMAHAVRYIRANPANNPDNLLGMYEGWVPAMVFLRILPSKGAADILQVQPIAPTPNDRNIIDHGVGEPPVPEL